MLDHFQRTAPERFIFDQHVNVDAGGKARQFSALLEQVGQHDVAHAESNGGQVHLAPADQLHEVVVATAAGDGAELAFAIERLEHHARVIGEPANDVVVHFDKLAQPAGGKLVDHGLQFFGRLAGLDEVGHRVERDADFGKLLRAHVRLLTLKFVDRLIESVSLLGLAAVLLEELLPRVAAAQADDEVFGGQTGRAQ